MFAGLMGDVWIKYVAQLKGRSKPPLHCLNEPSGGGRQKVRTKGRVMRKRHKGTQADVLVSGSHVLEEGKGLLSQ